MRARVVVYWLVVGGLALPALVLTLARIVQPEGSTIAIAAVAFTPWAMPLYAALLLFTGVRLHVVRRWSDAALPLAAVAVAGLVVHGWWYAPQMSGANPSPVADARPVVVMTANVFVGTADVAAVVDEVRQAGVDLLVVSEVTGSSLAAMDAAGLAELLPHRVGEPAEEGDPSGTMAFSHDPVSSVEPLATELEGWLFTSGDLVVVAAHLSAPGDPELWRSDHDAVAEVVADAEPDLVVGDLNATVDHTPLRRLADAGYRDAGELTNAGWHPTWPTQSVRELPGVPMAQIDHVLVGPRLAATSMRTVEIRGSDHRALLAVVAQGR